MRQIINVLTGDISTVDEVAPSFPTPAKPREIHIAWFKAALADLGFLDAVETAVATLPTAKRIMWEYATSIIEIDADVIAIAGALRIDLAAVFNRAEEIRAGKFG